MKSFRSGGFLFLYSSCKQFDPKFAVVVSRKIDKRAVRRNWLRRRVYELFRIYFLEKNLRFNVICLYKGSSIPENKRDLEAAVAKLARYLQNINLNK